MAQNQTLKKYVIVRCSNCRFIHGHALLKLTNRKTGVKCPRCTKTTPLTRTTILYTTDNSYEANRVIIHLKRGQVKSPSEKLNFKRASTQKH